MMEPILEDVANRLESEAKVAKVDTDKAPKLGHKYQVRIIIIIIVILIVMIIIIVMTIIIVMITIIVMIMIVVIII